LFRKKERNGNTGYDGDIEEGPGPRAEKKNELNVT